MSRRAGRLTRVALRLGLLLGGVAAAWGVHEVAAGAAAHAAERPPAAPLTATVDLITDVLGPVLGAVTPPAEDAARPSGAGGSPAPTERPDARGAG
ncbi:hypothetical protein ACW0Q9_30305, partial [Micromonospora sp. I033]